MQLESLLHEAKAADQLRADRNATAAHPVTNGIPEDRQQMLDVLAEAVSDRVPPVASCLHLAGFGLSAALAELASTQQRNQSSAGGPPGGRLPRLQDLASKET